jgi:hypothetical protein
MYSSRILFSHIFFFLIIQNLFAQTPINNCSDTFDGIQESCIRSNIDNFKNDPIIVEEKIIDNVYFYQTPNGGLGKMKILSIVADKNMTKDDLARGLNECSVYIQSATYFNNKAFSPDATFSIRQDYGVWTEDGIAFEKFGNDHIVLKRKVAPKKEDDRCILDPVGMKLALYKKMSDRNIDTGKGKYLFYMASFLIALAVFLVARSTLEEENKFKDTVSKLVKFDKMKVYRQNVEWSGELVREKIKWVFSLNENNGCYISIKNEDMLQLTTEVIETLKKYNKGIYDNMITWIQDNISNIVEIVFKRGWAKHEEDFADIVWYKNLVDDDQGVYLLSKLRNPDMIQLNYLGKNNWFGIFKKFRQTNGLLDKIKLFLNF